MVIAMELHRYIEDLEKRIDAEVEEELFSQWKQFCTGRAAGDVFAPRRKRKAAPPAIEWPRFSINEAMACPEKMVLQQLTGCSDTISGDSGRLMTVARQLRRADPRDALRLRIVRHVGGGELAAKLPSDWREELAAMGGSRHA